MGKKQHEKYKHLLNVSPSSINKPYIQKYSWGVGGLGSSIENTALVMSREVCVYVGGGGLIKCYPIHLSLLQH